ncbi:Oidioi.mRNA.OKI2018_I69.chr1.g3415.t1.cds [Oikopleura dioica]|uniref:Oidioi.mRNA.OKI2018_I69.chr1.g3415.t1.cds n=1 Tax=Oikopleura dioica TaxID=34765 RepID=A0ABN7SZG4_OIKDI|nr:Oidioi.mRNA.OKI2018_I69.chr1.g3415.t1.cds [Oikopleura dioica]
MVRFTAVLLSISFTGFLKYRLDEFHLDVTDLQLLLAASFKSTACLWTDETTDASKMDFLSFFFYPSTITGPWISFSNFLQTKREEENLQKPSLSTFFLDSLKWVFVTILLEAAASWFYTSLLIRDVSLIEHCPWLSLIALVSVITFKTWAELYFCYGLNYAVIKLDGMEYNPPRPVWLNDGFRQVWRTYDHGQHQILKENVYKPILKEGGNEILAAFCSFMLVAFWHSPLPYYKDGRSNWNSILAYFVFGFGNFFFTVAETALADFKIAGFKVWKAFAFIAIYPVNIYFICSNFQLANIIISRLFFDWNIIVGVIVGYCAVIALEKKKISKDLV